MTYRILKDGKAIGELGWRLIGDATVSNLNLNHILNATYYHSARKIIQPMNKQ